MPFGDTLAVAVANEIVASFCLACFQPGRSFLLTRTLEGITLKAVNEDATASRIILPEATSAPGPFVKG
jgi:hypothetical protein